MKRGLETVKRQHGRKKLSDGKTIGGKNRLSVHNILRLQMTFASTIRKSKHDLDLLFKVSWAIYWHKYSTNDDPRHDYCSIDWCGYLKSIRDKTPYDHTSHGLSRPVLDAIKPVFNNLCSRESLARVVDASTQNPNEGFHSLVWLMSPKHKASSGTTFEIACCLAVIIFNDGYFALGDIFNIMCGYRGYYTDQAMVHFDNSRLHTESKENNRKRRKEADRIPIQNDDDEEDNDAIIDGADQVDDDDKDTNPVNKATLDDNDTTTDSDEHVNDDNHTTSSNDESSDDDYGYYNPKDKRTWIEEQ
ncbi:unnamed protein product [Rotaria magnacalcarata]|uniref:Uncharacterized protein n=1 Tax=Rotaria magnacalcarata TaxID=392030 RepID=A0A816ZQ32_9BILA|nr:unnamed protein product [Rotaria magnacalcarata]CAF4358445.1 unnamed protein product [Rotaria magnacalcarata]